MKKYKLILELTFPTIYAIGDNFYTKIWESVELEVQAENKSEAAQIVAKNLQSLLQKEIDKNEE